MMTTCAVIPVKGRHDLLHHTIRRLKEKNQVDHVICVISTFDDEYFCKLHADFVIYHPNHPLGSKWNAGFEWAWKNINPDAYVFVGSSDWLCDNYLDVMLPELDGYDMIGKPDMHLYDIARYGRRLCYWSGYNDKRKGEPIGIGRLISAGAMNKMKGRPFRDDLDSSLDYNMLKHITSSGGRIALIENEKIPTLSLSCYLWGNKHSFEDHWRGHLPSLPLGGGKEWMKWNFPEALEIPL